MDGRLFEEHLIHRTVCREMRGSKSEVIIANPLAARGIDHAYERPLALDGASKYPDFTIEDMVSGRTIYRERGGMLHVPSYCRR